MVRVAIYGTVLSRLGANCVNARALCSFFSIGNLSIHAIRLEVNNLWLVMVLLKMLQVCVLGVDCTNYVDCKDNLFLGNVIFRNNIRFNKLITNCYFAYEKH